MEDAKVVLDEITADAEEQLRGGAMELDKRVKQIDIRGEEGGEGG